MKFFLNPENRVYLRGLATEFKVSTNTVRQELEKLTETGVIESRKNSKKRMFRVNMEHPLYHSIRKLMMQQSGIETIYEYVIMRIGELEQVYLTGPLAKGTDSSIIDMIIIGDVDRDFLHELTLRAEGLTGKKVRVALYAREEWKAEYLNGIDFMKML